MFKRFLERWRLTVSVSAAVMAISATVSAQTLYAGDISITFGSVTDTCAFEFSLWDATAGGTRIGPAIERELPVRGGLYDVELDFGLEAIEDGSRFLEVSVGCPAGTAELTTLTRKAFLSTTATEDDRSGDGTPATRSAAAPPKAALGTAFTYQGELQESGAPVTGAGDFQFSLWDALQGGSQIGATVAVNGVAVADGRFAASLDFGAAAFDGDARWLEIAVVFPTGTGSFTTLSPRQPLNAAPYALQTRGIFVDDAGDVGIGTTNPQRRLEVSDNGSIAMRVRNTASGGGVAIQATANGDTGWATAVDAYTASPGGIGVYAFNEAETGSARGVQAETASIDGVAISGVAWNDEEHSTGVGVFGRSDGDYGAAGVKGEATASGGGSYGVHGIASTGSGVYGRNTSSDNRGWLGTAIAGVEGQAARPTDYSGYFTGGPLRVDSEVKLHTVSGFKTIDLDPEYGSGNAGRFEIQGNGDYAVISATGNGSGLDDATFRVNNSQASGGMAAYATSNANSPTVRIDNDGSGASLRLENSGGGDLLVAHDGALGQDRLRVGGDGVTHVTDLEVTGAYQGTLGPNNGAPFPRPAYDSGWVLLDQGDFTTLSHGIGGDVSDYVIDLQSKGTDWGIHNLFTGGDRYQGDKYKGVFWFELTSSQVKVLRMANDGPNSPNFRHRIWVVN